MIGYSGMLILFYFLLYFFGTYFLYKCAQSYLFCYIFFVIYLYLFIRINQREKYCLILSYMQWKRKKVQVLVCLHFLFHSIISGFLELHL